MQLSGAEITIELLKRQGMDIITGIPGGCNLPLYDALHRDSRDGRGGIRHVLARHEQGAGFIAQGIARATGKAAVTFATSGPGVTNLLTAIADAYRDSIPLVAITGQVDSSLIGTDAFQEIDTYGLTVPITKHNFLVRSAGELPDIIPAAFQIALSGRPGPVVIDIPKNVQTERIELKEWPGPGKAKAPPAPDESAIREIAARINRAERPLIYAGGGIIHSGAKACKHLLELARKNSIPAAMTLMGLGAFPPDDPLCLGMLGMHGSRGTNALLNEADLVIALGARFDDRATGCICHFCPDAGIIHVDIDASEIDKLRKSGVSLTADAGAALEKLVPMIEKNERTEWSARTMELRGKYPLAVPADDRHPVNLVRRTAEIAGRGAIFTTDVGQHQMWAAQGCPVYRPRSFLTSGGLGTMGFGLPAAIGAALAEPGRKVVCFSGDGSLLMNIQELATLAELGLDVKIVLLNNGRLGLVRQQQQLFYNGNYFASRFEKNPDFAAIARAFGINGIRCENPDGQIREALHSSGPCLLDIPLDPELNVLPMVPPGGAITEPIE